MVAVMRSRTRPASVTTAGVWVCLLLLGWALAGSWLGHTAASHCTSGACHVDAGDPGCVALAAAAIEERDVCLACHLLRCLQTASPSAIAAVPVLASEEPLPPRTAPVASVAAGVKGSARSPPAV